MRTLAVLLIPALMAAPALLAEAPSEERVAQARALFETYVELEHAFDPAVADLYADDAIIRHTLRDPAGPDQEREWSGVEYKRQLRQVMPLAERLGDKSRYSEVTYEPRDDGTVSIRGVRLSERTGKTSPFELVVAPHPEGPWVIVEEIAESHKGAPAQ